MSLQKGSCEMVPVSAGSELNNPRGPFLPCVPMEKKPQFIPYLLPTTNVLWIPFVGGA